MKINRRDFVRTTGSLALAGIAAGALFGFPALAGEEPLLKQRIAIFFDPAFPAADIAPPDQAVLQQALQGYELVFLDLPQLKEQLVPGSFDLLITPYGSAFPKDAYSIILSFLTGGGNWVNLGGVPLSVPVVKEGESWRQEIRQTAHHKKLGITQAFPVSARGVASYEADPAFEGAHELLGEFQVQEAYAFYVCFTRTKDYPAEDGSAGARDAILRPLVSGIDAQKRKRSVPFLCIDRMQGPFAGGRWMFAAFNGSLTPNAIRTLTDAALEGVLELTVRSSFACYYEGEVPAFSVQLKRPRGTIGHIARNECRIDIYNERGRNAANFNIQLSGNGSLLFGSEERGRDALRKLSPGLYRVEASVKVRSSHPDSTSIVRETTGFWVYDAKLLAGGIPFTAGNDYFMREGKPYPVTGTTYMSSETHRKFLFEPNPHAWHRDFTEMKAAGINMVRTGIWTAWRNYMLDAGAPHEAALRAMDAFVLTARRHEMPLILTFFAFLPEQWGGENPYLDPRAIDAQKEFLATFAHRYRMVNDIMWDLINEPSFCSAERLWNCRPNYDNHETAAWNAWLKEQNAQIPGDGERRARMQEHYRMAADESIALPAVEEFGDANFFNERRPIKVIDYKLFAQAAFTGWVKEMTAALRSNGNTHQLITVGQDEGGTYERPGPQFFGPAVDFTSIHNWWFNDDLLWDQVMTKVAGKPNLAEETGVMFYETMDGKAWRTEEDARNLLERKFALSLSAGGAGFIQWIWNTNPYMASENEAAIGTLRADGSAKPELDALTRIATFISSHRHLMNGREEPDVMMVIPHSLMFSVRNFATEATRRCVRLLSYHLGIPVTAVSEYRLSPGMSYPKLILLPSPRVLHERAWESLRAAVEQGSTLVITGIFDADAHWLPTERLKQLGLSAGTRPVAQEEFVLIDGTEYQASYRGEKIQRLEKALPDGKSPSHTATIPLGKGRIIWCPLPLENSDSIEPALALYRFALTQARVAPAFTVETKDSSVLVLPTLFTDAALYTLVSESGRDTHVTITHTESHTEFTLSLKAQRTAMAFIRRQGGEVVAMMEEESAR